MPQEEMNDSPVDTTDATDVPVEVTTAEAEEPAAQPDIAAIAKNIKANYDFNVNVKPVTFHFKSTKDPETGITTKRDSIELAIPYPSMQGIIDIIETGGKELDLLLEAVEDVVTRNARALITDDQEVTAATLPVEKLSWKHIANMPKPERNGGGISKETWAAFAQDYQEVMPEAAGKTPEQVAYAAKLLVNKFAAVKTNFPVLEMLLQQLAIYAESSENAAVYAECINFLTDKADKLMKVTPEELLANL